MLLFGWNNGNIDVYNEGKICMVTDTIAAIATGLSDSGIGIVRISGEDAFSVIRQIFKGKNGGELQIQESHRVHYGCIFDGKEKIDEVLVLVMKGPHSYTAEDTVEINGHGGVRVMQRILELVIRHGARPAEPGEFTKRAFLHGRIDLAQAEAVMDLIHAQNDYALKASVSQLGGSVSKKIRELREKILYSIAFIESALDDPEHISLEGYAEQLGEELEETEKEIIRLTDSFSNGKVMTEGIKTVILGKPNVGKSSLMNVLLGEERAIVTDIAGTTRDTLEEKLSLGGITLNVVDTAGIRDTQDIVEQIGVDRAKQAALDADLVIYVVDGSEDLDENDQEIMAFIRDKKAVVLLNKVDLEMKVSVEELEEKTGKKVIPVSAKEERGLDALEEEIKQSFYGGELRFNDEVIITNVRHKAALEESLESIRMVKKSIEDGLPEDFFSIDLMNAYEGLGRVIGEAVEDDLVNEIFARFCMGK